MKCGRGAALAGAILLTAAAWGQSGAVGNYHAAGVGNAMDVAYPVGQAPGIVTLDVSVDAGGNVQGMRVVRDVPPLTTTAVSAIKTWQFTPALKNGQAAAGMVRVHIVFNPFRPSGTALPHATLVPPNNNGAAATGDFQPAQVTAASYAAYPPYPAIAGTVVLQVQVGSGGKAQGVIVARGTGSVSGTAAKAVMTWLFTPGRYQGKTVVSDVVVAYVFAPPTGTM